MRQVLEIIHHDGHDIGEQNDEHIDGQNPDSGQGIVVVLAEYEITELANNRIHIKQGFKKLLGFQPLQMREITTIMGIFAINFSVFFFFDLQNIENQYNKYIFTTM